MANYELADMILPADLGFGYGKAKFKGREYKQPSIVGEPRRVHTQDILDSDLQIGKVTFAPNKGEYFEPTLFVGNLAVRHSNARYFSTGDNRSNMWTTKVQLQSMLGHLAPYEDVFLVTGLPLDFYFQQIDEMKKFLGGFKSASLYDMQIGENVRKNISTSVIDYHIVPQPMGACMNYLLDEKGAFRDVREATQIIVVGDLGFHTFDLLVYDGGEIHRLSHSTTDISIANGYKLVQEWLRPHTVSVPDLYTLDAAMLKGEYQGIDLTEYLSKMCETLARQIKFELESLNLQYFKYIGTGGWSSLVTPLLGIPEGKVQSYGQDGNMNGYYKIGMRKCLSL